MGRWPLLACTDGNLVGPRWCVLGLAVSCRAGVVRPRHRAPGIQQGQNTKPPAHQILVMRPHLAGPDDRRVDQAPVLYMVAQLKGRDTLLTGLLDRSALY